MAQVFFEGFFLQASLIFALGAQNLYVLESGLRRRHRLAVSFTCFLCDLTIIMMGVLGMATVLKAYPEVKIFVGVLGIGFMVHYGISKLRGGGEEGPGADLFVGTSTLWKSVLKAITFSVVNPHAYLDGIVLIGGYATKYAATEERLFVGLGAASYSLLWFLMLSNASSTMMPILTSGRRMRTAMALSGVVLLFLSFKLTRDVYGWVQESREVDEALVSGPTR